MAAARVEQKTVIIDEVTKQPSPERLEKPLLAQISDNLRPPKSMLPPQSEQSRILIKKLNADKKARERKRMEVMKAQEEKFKIELEGKERELRLKQEQKLLAVERKREETKARMQER